MIRLLLRWLRPAPDLTPAKQKKASPMFQGPERFHYTYGKASVHHPQHKPVLRWREKKQA